MRIVLIGCVKSSEVFLKKLIKMKIDIVGVITKSKSKFNADFVDLGIICRNEKIDYLYVNHINDSSSKEYIQSKEADLILCLGWSQLLDHEVLAMPKKGCIGFHPAELPNNKGRHPLIWALVLGLEKTASTFFWMEQKADTGKIISQESISITYSDDAATLYSKVMKVAVIQLEQILCRLEKGETLSIICKVEEGNVWRKRGKEDGLIDWRMSSRSIYNLVRALNKPYVGAHFIHKGEEYKVWKVRELVDINYSNIEAGKVISVSTPNHFIVKVGDNLIEILDCEMININAGEYL